MPSILHEIGSSSAEKCLHGDAVLTLQLSILEGLHACHGH